MLTDILADCFLPTNKITLAQIVNHEKTIFDKKNLKNGFESAT